MKSPMDPAAHQAAVQRSLALGRGGDPSALPELIAMLRLPSHEVQRLAASAIGKLAAFGADPGTGVKALLELALRAQHPQVQQYAIRALGKFGTDAADCVADLQDLARNPALRDYVRTAAGAAADAIEQASADTAAGIKHRCQRCAAALTPEEAARSQAEFRRPYCGRCFDEVFLERRNFETKVELNKTIAARDGTMVQSRGERMIADWLHEKGIRFHHDMKFRILSEFQIRPDFYLPELDLYIEYWGLDTPQYMMSMYKKRMLYQQQGKRLISLYPKDLPSLGAILAAKLKLFGYHVAPD